MLLELKNLGSVRAAAQSLHLTQPAISKTLHEVEDVFGFELFARGARGLRPTPRGEVVLRGASALLAELELLLGDASSAQPELETLRIGAPPFVAQGLVPAILASARQTIGPLRIVLRESGVPQLLEMVTRGELDVALTSYNAATLAASHAEQLRIEKLCDEQFVVIAPARHPVARRTGITWDVLAREDWILPSEGSVLRQLVETRFIAAGVVPPQPVILSNSPVTNVCLVGQGLGFASVPASTIRRAGRVGGAGIRSLAISPGVDSVPVALVYRSGALAHGRVAQLREIVHASIKQRMRVGV